MSPFSLSRLLTPLALTAVLASVVRAHGNGMDMSMDGAMDLAAGMMIPWLHFTPGDVLWFYGWVPSSKGAMVGTCIGLFLLGLVDRWMAVCRAVMEAHWSKRAQIILADRMNASSAGKDKVRGLAASRVRDAVTMRNGPPFIAAHDIPRGIIHAVQSALHFAIMLAIMTFQVSFIISIVVGLGVGETLFGRFASHAGHH